MEENKKNIIDEIVSSVSQKFNIKNIILFGSYAYGIPDKNSDIDLITVLDESGISSSFKERMERKNRVTKTLIELMKKIPIDILVYTKDEWKKMISLNSSFVNVILKKGIVLK